MGLVFYWVGAALYAYFQVAQVKPLPAGTGINHVFPYFILEVLPAGVTGLLVAAIFAAAMSSLDSAITALSNTTVKDFLGKGSEDQAKLLKTARFWVIIWGILGTLARLYLCGWSKIIADQSAVFHVAVYRALVGFVLICVLLSKVCAAIAFNWCGYGYAHTGSLLKHSLFAGGDLGTHLPILLAVESLDLPDRHGGFHPIGGSIACRENHLRGLLHLGTSL